MISETLLRTNIVIVNGFAKNERILGSSTGDTERPETPDITFGKVVLTTSASSTKVVVTC